jgi:ligand-binding sensor domain-containing protein
MQRSSLHLCCQSLVKLQNVLSARAPCALFIAAALLLVLSSATSAQSVSDRHWVTYRQPDGLASNDVFAIVAQDGAVWVATANGVSRYNGLWQSYTTMFSQTPDGFEQVPFGKVTALALDRREGRLWAGIETGVVARWQEDTGWLVVSSIDAKISSLASSGNTLWIGTDSGLLRLEDGALQPVSEIGETPIYAIKVLDGFVWIGAQDALWMMSDNMTAIEEHRPRHQESGALLNGPFTAIWLQSVNDIWAATPTTIFEYYADRREAVSYPFPFGNDVASITAIEVAEKDSIWVTSNGAGAAQFRLAGKEIASMRSWGSAMQGGLTADNVRDVVTDQDGSVWFATSVGVYRYQPWAFLDVGDIVDALPVNDLMFDRLGNLWVATAGEGVQVRSDRYRQATVYLPDGIGLPGGTIYALQQDELGRVWAATNRGIAYYESQKWRQPPVLRNEALTTVGVMRADALGLWIGTASGLLRYQFANQSIYTEPLTRGQSITAMEFDSLGQLWVAGGNGAIWRYTTDQRWQRVTRPAEPMPSDTPVAVFAPESEPPGSMLVAFRSGGVYRYQNSTWISLEKSRKIGEQRIYALLSDPATDSIWIGGETGLTRIDSYGVARFDSQDGLQLGAVRAIVRDASGGYWFGGDRGLAYYTPEQGKPWVHVAEVRGADWQEQSQGWGAHTDVPIEVAFTYGDLQTNAAKLQIFSRLLHDDEVQSWQLLPTKMFLSTFATPGRYTLEFMVRDQALNYSPVQSIDFVVTPAPVYVAVPILGKVESRVFQLLVLFGMLAVVGFGFVSFEIVQHRRRVGEAVARGFNPYISGEPVRREDMFFGRHELLQRIVSTLHNNSIMIHGERRIGKTTLLYQLANTLRQINDRDYWFAALYVDLEGTTETTFFHFLMEEIAHHVYTLDGLDTQYLAILDGLHYHAAPANFYSDREFSRDLRQIIAILEAYGAEHRPGKQLRLILLMDEMDTVSRFNHLVQQQLRRIFMREFAVSLGAVVAGIEISKDWERIESPWFNMFNEIAMQPFTRQESIQLLVEPVRGYYLYEPEALDFILQQSDGRPYRLQQYGLEAVNEMLRHKRRRITQRDALIAHQIILENSQLGVSAVTALEPESPGLIATAPNATPVG